jgi:HAD superfamily hydrolase (TIGR01509 family)
VTRPAAILDVDGTLVDTNYQHALSWHRAFVQHDIFVPVWRVHRAIGMGGDQLIPALAGQEVEDEHGDDIRAAEKALYMDGIGLVQVLPGARDFVLWLAERGHAAILSSSAKEEELEVYLELLDVGGTIAGHTTSADVEATKPEPDVIEAALEKLGRPEAAVMIGDSVFDVEAAKRAGLPTLALLTGGFGADELREAGAAGVFTDLAELRGRVAETPLGA